MTFQRTLIAACAAGLMATTAFAMTPAEHKAAKEGISADYKMNKEKCDALKANAKDICQKEAKGIESVAKADLEAQYKPSDKTAYKAREARADADDRHRHSRRSIHRRGRQPGGHRCCRCR